MLFGKTLPIGKSGQWGRGVAPFTTPPLLSLGGKAQSTPKLGIGVHVATRLVVMRLFINRTPAIVSSDNLLLIWSKLQNDIILQNIQVSENDNRG